MAAAFGGHVDTVRVLLDAQGILVNQQDMNGMTALHFAVFRLPSLDSLVAELLRCPAIRRNLRDATGVRFSFRKPLMITSGKVD
jgi:hypothetical protein